MEIEESNQDSQGQGEALRRETFPVCSHDYRIDTDPFIKNIASNTLYPGEWFELDANNLSVYMADSLFSLYPSPAFSQSSEGMSGIPSKLSRQEGANDMEAAKKAPIFRGTIMVVSKDHEFLNSLYSIFGDLGYHVVPAETYGYELLGVLDEVAPNLAIIDIGMPSMLGVNTTLLIRLHTAIPTILLTKWQTESNTFRKLDVDSPDALSEPITSNELVKLVDSVKMWHQDVNR